MSELNLNSNFGIFQIDSFGSTGLRQNHIRQFKSGHVDVMILEGDFTHIRPLGSRSFDYLVWLKI